MPLTSGETGLLILSAEGRWLLVCVNVAGAAAAAFLLLNAGRRGPRDP